MLEVVMSNVGTYLTIEDVISDLNIMIVEAPIPNHIAIILANVVGKLKGKKYRLFSDPGHSWLEVSFDELVSLGINKKITAWSYYKGNNVYLEEDVDAPLYLQTKKDLTGEVTEYEEITSDYNSPIRSYSPYYFGTMYDD